MFYWLEGAATSVSKENVLIYKQNINNIINN